jgi:hypothetical protein
MKRTSNENAIIQNLPISLKTHKSEYTYLFDLIFKFHKNGCDENDDNFLLMPNALRRFLEIYTLMKLPHAESELESRVVELMGEGHKLKILHHFSHFTSFEKITKHDELIINLKAACEDIITILESDEKHFNSLKKAINEPIEK